MRVLLTILSLSWLLAFGQFPQVKEGHKNMLFLNATAFVEGERVINKAAVGVKDGVITLVENALSYTPDKSEWDTIIDMKGYTMYPGFISANNTLGLTEIDAVRATNDFRETAAYSPEIESYVAFNTQSEVIYTVRTNGVLISQATPRARRIGGQSSMLRLNAWNYEDALIRKNDGMHIYWPTFMKRWGHKPGEPAFNKKYIACKSVPW